MYTEKSNHTLDISEYAKACITLIIKFSTLDNAILDFDWFTRSRSPNINIPAERPKENGKKSWQ